MPSPSRWKPQLIQASENVYCSTGYAIANVLYVTTSSSVVVIDTTETIPTARASLADFRQISTLPISHIIYTHSHNDHIMGARAFHSPGTMVIAQKLLENERQNNHTLCGYRLRADILQFGLTLPVKDRGVTHRANYFPAQRRRAAARDVGVDNRFVAPDVTFDDKYLFTQGGINFELYHTEGETYDHLMVWLPNQGVLFPGDLFYGNFPMLNNPLKPIRPILNWARSLDRMRELKPRFLVPSHGKPVLGAEAVDAALANYAEAIRYVHDETVRHMNKGLMVEEICRLVRLPPHLAALPYLQERYGTIRWTVRGIFHEYGGWYSWHPKDLRPSPRATFAQAVLETHGAAAPLLRRARQALLEGNAQLALELADLVISARPRNRVALSLSIGALEALAEKARNGVERNIYLAAAQEAAHLVANGHSNIGN
jgi:linear primary-alkylsulfatase